MCFAGVISMRWYSVLKLNRLLKFRNHSLVKEHLWRYFTVLFSNCFVFFCFFMDLNELHIYITQSCLLTTIDIQSYSFCLCHFFFPFMKTNFLRMNERTVQKPLGRFGDCNPSPPLVALLNIFLDPEKAYTHKYYLKIINTKKHILDQTKTVSSKYPRFWRKKIITV